MNVHLGRQDCMYIISFKLPLPVTFQIFDPFAEMTTNLLSLVGFSCGKFRCQKRVKSTAILNFTAEIVRNGIFQGTIKIINTWMIQNNKSGYRYTEYTEMDVQLGPEDCVHIISFNPHPQSLNPSRGVSSMAWSVPNTSRVVSNPSHNVSKTPRIWNTGTTSTRRWTCSWARRIACTSSPSSSRCACHRWAKFWNITP